MKLTVLSENNELDIDFLQEKNLLAILQDNNAFVSNSCNGNGTCGKCKVKVVSGKLPVTEADRRIVSEEELEQGIRLACKAIIDENSEEKICIELIGSIEEKIIVETVAHRAINSNKKVTLNSKNQNYFIAIDIGTTTIAMALVDCTTGEVCDTYASVNHQRKYGADVISRIMAANEGKGRELKQIIEEDLWRGIYYLQEKIAKSGILGIVIAGNTTMHHLLMGYSCESLGKYPFTSEYLEGAEYKLKESIGFGQKQSAEWVYDIPVLLMPGISAFVGGDIVAGLCVCPGFGSEELSLFLDLGTNGEMVLGNKNRMLATSVAAGPAFEGGNISCGTASIPGSISRVKISNRKAIIGTIDKKMPPIGICGSGLISAVAQLLQEKLLDFHGNLIQPFQKEGFPLWTFSDGHKMTLSQGDIRQFQMAKSAVRSGIEILMREYGCQAEDIQAVYLAGGFGTGLLEEDVIATGILPKEWRGKIQFLGNTSLKGAIEIGKSKYGNTESAISEEEKMTDIIEKVSSVSLANKEEFHQIYIENMEFVSDK